MAKKKSRLNLKMLTFKPGFLQMNGTPRGRTSRLKQRRTESRQEQNFPHFFNFFQKILILLFLIIFILHFLIIFILQLKVYIFCSFREEEEVVRRRGGCWLSTRWGRRYIIYIIYMIYHKAGEEEGKALTAVEAQLIQPGPNLCTW